MRVIGLTGPAGAGKDTVAQMLLDMVAGAKRQGFADLLKLSAARIFLPECDLDGALRFCNRLKSAGDVTVGDGGVPAVTLSGRAFLQRYGTEAHRDVFSQDFWLDAVLPEGRNDCPLLAIPDARFENEGQRILERGGEVWKIDRPNVQPVDAHSSESGLPAELVTRTILNDSTLEVLEARVRQAL